MAPVVSTWHRSTAIYNRGFPRRCPTGRSEPRPSRGWHNCAEERPLVQCPSCQASRFGPTSSKRPNSQGDGDAPRPDECRTSNIPVSTKYPEIKVTCGQFDRGVVFRGVKDPQQGATWRSNRIFSPRFCVKNDQNRTSARTRHGIIACVIRSVPRHPCAYLTDYSRPQVCRIMKASCQNV